MGISGELRIEQGDPVLRGTDKVPLRISGEGFNGHWRWLQRQVLRKGAFVVGLLIVAVSLWFEVYVPLAVLIGGWLGYVGDHSVEDVRIFLEWIRD